MLNNYTTCGRTHRHKINQQHNETHTNSVKPWFMRLFNAIRPVNGSGA